MAIKASSEDKINYFCSVDMTNAAIHNICIQMGSILLYIELNLYGEIDLFHYDLRDSEVIVLWITPILRVVQCVVLEQYKLDYIRIEY